VGGPLLMRFLGLFNKEIAETVEMMYEWANLNVVNISKVEEAFGLKPTLLEILLKELEHLRPGLALYTARANALHICYKGMRLVLIEGNFIWDASMV
jgi:hypothetical protein